MKQRILIPLLLAICGWVSLAPISYQPVQQILLPGAISAKSIEFDRVTVDDVAGTQDVDWVNGVTVLTVTDDTILTFSNLPDAFVSKTIRVTIIQDGTGGHSISWPGAVVTPDSILVNQQANSVTSIFLTSDDGGATIKGQSDYGTPVTFCVALSDETTAIDSSGTKAKLRAPYAFTVTGARASLGAGTTTGTFTIDISEDSSSIFSTALTIDATETTSTIAETPFVLSDTAIADDAELSFDVTDTGDDTATGAKVCLYGYR